MAHYENESGTCVKWVARAGAAPLNRSLFPKPSDPLFSGGRHDEPNGVEIMMVSVHIPKTGGTSFEKILRHLFKDGFYPDYDEFLLPEAKYRIEAQLQENPSKIKCIHGHFGARKYINYDADFVSWVRDPLERAASAYYYLRTEPSSYPPEFEPTWVRDAKAMSLEDYLLTTNHDTNRLDLSLNGLPIDEYAFLGVTEYFSQSISIFMRKFFGGKQVSIPRERVNFRRTAEKYEISASARREFERKNERDVEIYKKALELHRKAALQIAG